MQWRSNRRDLLHRDAGDCQVYLVDKLCLKFNQRKRIKVNMVYKDYNFYYRGEKHILPRGRFNVQLRH